MLVYLSVFDTDDLRWKDRRVVHNAVFELARRNPDAVTPFSGLLLSRALAVQIAHLICTSARHQISIQQL
jgi:hypothetical protein